MPCEIDLPVSKFFNVSFYIYAYINMLPSFSLFWMCKLFNTIKYRHLKFRNFYMHKTYITIHININILIIIIKYSKNILKIHEIFKLWQILWVFWSVNTRLQNTYTHRTLHRKIEITNGNVNFLRLVLIIKLTGNCVLPLTRRTRSSWLANRKDCPTMLLRPSVLLHVAVIALASRIPRRIPNTVLRCGAHMFT